MYTHMYPYAGTYMCVYNYYLFQLILDTVCNVIFLFKDIIQRNLRDACSHN